MSRDRDRKLEQALTHELRAAGTPDRDACVDAETLGAWADGGLEAAQMAAVEWHVSSCARCQAIVGATARSAPLISGTEAAGTSFLWRWWLAPLTAAAAAVTLWMVVPQRHDTVLAPPSVLPPSVAAPAPETFAQNQPPKDQPIPLAPSPAKPAEERTAVAARAQRGNTREKASDARRERPEDLSGKKEAALAKTKRDAADAPKLLQDRNAAAGAAPAAPAAVPLSTPAVGALLESARFAPAPLEIVSPDPSSRWRIRNGAIERSEDGGTSWIAIQPRAGESITGGTAPARSICWLIGSNGLVMVTTDGLTFARVPLPERVDLTAVTATDARTAIVTTADGRRFSTDDAGRTWRRN
jgi:hypothetical protein